MQPAFIPWRALVYARIIIAAAQVNLRARITHRPWSPNIIPAPYTHEKLQPQEEEYVDELTIQKNVNARI